MKSAIVVGVEKTANHFSWRLTLVLAIAAQVIANTTAVPMALEIVFPPEQNGCETNLWGNDNHNCGGCGISVSVP